MLEEEGHFRVYGDEFRQRVLGQLDGDVLLRMAAGGQQQVRAFHRLAETLRDAQLSPRKAAIVLISLRDSRKSCLRGWAMHSTAKSCLYVKSLMGTWPCSRSLL